MNDSFPVARLPIKSTLGLENQPLQRPQLYGALAISVTLIIAASLAAVFGQGGGQDLKVALAMAATVWSLADLLTAFLLLAQFYVNGRPLFGILAVAYAFDGLLTWPYLAVFPGVFEAGHPTTIGHQQISITLWMIWHAGFPVLVACAALDDSVFGRIVTRRAIRLATGIFAVAPFVLAAGVTTLVFKYQDLLPHFVSTNHFQTVYRVICMPAIVILCAVACLVVLATHQRRAALSLWLIVAMLAVALDAMLNITAVRYSFAWDMGKIITVFTASVVLTTILGDIARLYSRLASVARMDVLTSLPNRRAFEEHFELVLHDAERLGTSMGVLIVDVDNFKFYNDTFGHLAGDECLRRVAAEMLGCATRPLDVVARYGGEEFVVVLPRTDQAGVLAIAERIRASVETLAISYLGKPIDGVTVSIGIAFVPDARNVRETELLEAADRALYAAKNSGRNRAIVGTLDAKGSSREYATSA